MHSFMITTDAGADLPKDYCAAHEIAVLPLPVTMDGTTYQGDELDIKTFYELLRGGSLPTTSAANLEDTCALYRSILSQGHDLLHIAFSSGLSSTASTAVSAAVQVQEEFPERTLLVVDSLCASYGQGLLVHQAVKRRAQGLSIQTTCDQLEALKGNIVHNFTVDDLNHLHRGGRVSKATAVVGTLMGIKPILHVDDTGHLVAIGKVRGRKAAIGDLLDRMERQIVGFENQEVFISHGDCLQDAENLAQQIRERLHIENISIADIGPTIGTHSGPGTLALFFLGSPR